MEREEVERISRELEELLDMQDGEKKSLPAAEALESAQKEYSRLMEGEDSYEEEAESVQAEEPFLEEVEYVQEFEDQTGCEEEDEEEITIRNFIRPGDGLVAAFLVPVLIMLIIFLQRGIFPFGEESFLRTDMYHQYAPFFSEFQYKLTHGGSLLYSWDVGMGVNFSALYAYYLASPLNWLLIFCPKNLIIEFMTYSIVLKTGLAGLSMAWYLRRHCRTRDFGAAFFGIFYALSGYMAAYSWNIMWLDCIILFPVVMLGLERLVKEQKGFLYCIALGMSILSNYYISIMICIFMVIYFGALLILEGFQGWKRLFQAIWQFTVYSLLAGGLAAAVLLPEIFALQATASGDFNFPKTVSSYFSIFDMIARHIGNVETEIGLDHWPNIYCGVAVFLLFLLYLGCKKISAKEKAVYSGMLLIFYASFSVNVLNFIWHGFHYPNSLPCRQSFIYIFLMLVICYRAYMHLKETPKSHISIAFFASAGFVILAEKLVTEDHFHFAVFYAALIFLAAYAGLMHLYRNQRFSRNILVLITLGLVSIESAVNMTITSVTTTSRTSYVKDNEEVRDLVMDLLPNDSFFRVEKVTRKTKNDGAWMNFPSVSLFSSTANADLSAFFKKIGCESSTNAYSITGSTPLVDALFSVKYGLYSEKPEYENHMSYVAESGETYLYENTYVLPLGFVVEKGLEDYWQLDMANPADVQNDLCMAVGASPVLIETYGEVFGNQYEFTPEESGEYYAFVMNRKLKDVTVTIGEDSKTFENTDRGYLLELGYLEGGQRVSMTCDSSQIMDVRTYRFDETGLAEACDILNRMPWRLTKWNDTELEGEVTAGQPGILFTSIPYDEGWEILVDGKPAEGQKLFDTFLGVDLAEGHHTIAMKYQPQGLKEGIMITAGSVIILVFIGILGILKRRKDEELPEEIQEDEEFPEEMKAEAELPETIEANETESEITKASEMNETEITEKEE
ncbi:MAG: YfhO family protein [Lachnospiraceae bacterium]